MKAIILSAGQGSRLMPLTEVTPKCCLRPGGVSILEWQITQLAVSGIDEVVVVTGLAMNSLKNWWIRFRASRYARCTTRFSACLTIMGTCWVARHEMDGTFVLINGDTLFEAAVLQHSADGCRSLSDYPGHGSEDFPTIPMT